MDSPRDTSRPDVPGCDLSQPRSSMQLHAMSITVLLLVFAAWTFTEIASIHDPLLARIAPWIELLSVVVGIAAMFYVGTTREEALAKAMASMRANEERVELALMAANDGLWDWNVITGETYFSPRWKSMVGYQPDELSSSVETWQNLLHPGDAERVAAVLQKTLDGGSEKYEVEFRMRHKDGHYVDVLARGLKLQRADGRPIRFVGTHADRTEQKRAENLLRQSEAHLRAATQSTGVGIATLDTNGRYLFANATYTALVRSSADLVGQTFGQLLAIDPSVLARGLQGERCEAREVTVRSRGQEIFLDVTLEPTHDAEGRATGAVVALEDVTEYVHQRSRLNELTANLAEQNERLRVTLMSIADAVITTDAVGNVAWLNPVAERLTGWSSAEAQGHPLAEVVKCLSETTREYAPPALPCQLDQAGPAATNTVLLLSRSGEEYGIKYSASCIRDERGEILGSVAVLHDETEQRRLAGEMSHRARHDDLTGLVNRVEFSNRLERAFVEAKEQALTHSLLWIDLDQFKLVNDTCGHAEGDRLLQQVAALLRQRLRSIDTVARLGGDEFAILLERCPVESAQAIAEEICECMEKYRFTFGDRRYRVGSSIGLVTVDSRWNSPEALIQAADSACFAAKAAGRNRVHVWVESDAQLIRRQGETQWAARLESALDEGRFVLFAQRFASLSNARGLHAEVLVRKIGEDGSLIPPGAFLSAAERFHLAPRLDRLVLGRAVETLKNTDDLASIACICVNLSGQSISDRAFHRHVIDLLQAAPPAVCNRLCLEITETAVVHNLGDAQVFMAEMRAIGVKMALDDFGAGASSFGYLKALPVDILKIDGQFIRSMLDDPLNAAAVRCFVDVARVQGIRTVAEFVEEQAVLDRLRDMGVDHAQGYLIHKPEPLETVLRASRVQPTETVEASERMCA